KHDLGELALSIGARAAVAARQHDIIEVDRMLAERRNVHDARRLAAHQKGKQNPGEQESGEVVDGKAQLVAVLADLSSTPRAARADAGTVGATVSAGIAPGDGTGEAPPPRAR